MDHAVPCNVEGTGGCHVVTAKVDLPLSSLLFGTQATIKPLILSASCLIQIMISWSCPCHLFTSSVPVLLLHYFLSSAHVPSRKSLAGTL